MTGGRLSQCRNAKRQPIDYKKQGAADNLDTHSNDGLMGDSIRVTQGIKTSAISHVHDIGR